MRDVSGEGRVEVGLAGVKGGRFVGYEVIGVGWTSVEGRARKKIRAGTRGESRDIDNGETAF